MKKKLLIVGLIAGLVLVVGFIYVNVAILSWG